MQSSPQDQSKAQTRKVALAGASGLVGGYLLQGLLADESVTEIHVLSRRTLNIRHPKLAVLVVDFKAIPPLPPLNEVYLALGTTIRWQAARRRFVRLILMPISRSLMRQKRQEHAVLA